MYKSNEDQLMPTETDLFIDMLKNSEKLVSESKRKNYYDFPKEVDIDNADNVDNLDNDVLDCDNTNNTKQQPMNDADAANNYYEQENIKVDTTKYTENQYSEKQTDEPIKMSKSEEILLKLDMLRKLLDLKRSGVKLSQNYSLDSDLEMMNYEYKLHTDIKAKHNSVTWMSHMLIGIMKGTEILNNMIDPFGIKLDGLSDKISSDIHNYYSVLGEIYEKYNQPGKQMAPEMRLLFMISGAALSMQLSKSLGMNSNNKDKDYKNEEEMYAELRKKAEEDSKKSKQYVEKQHDAALQKALDLKMIHEQELETQKINKTLNNTKFKENLIISSASPRDDKDEKEEQEKDAKSTTSSAKNILSKSEIDKLKNKNYHSEQKQLENIRKLANTKSKLFRENNEDVHNLDEQNKKLDEILASINNNSDSDSHFSSKSSKSVVSINKNIDKLMKTKQKNKKQFSDNDIDNILSDNSSKSSRKKKIDVSSISIGSKNKGVKPLVILG